MTAPGDLPRFGAVGRAVLRSLRAGPAGSRDAVGVSTDSYGRVARRLAEAGLVVRVAAAVPGAGRAAVWRLTEAGEDFARRVLDVRVDRPQRLGPLEWRAARPVLAGLVARAGALTVVQEVAPQVPASTVGAILRGLLTRRWVYRRRLADRARRPYGWALTDTGLREARAWLARPSGIAGAAAGGVG